MGRHWIRSCGYVLTHVVVSCLILTASAPDSRADHNLDRLELKFSIDREKLQQPLVQLRDAYSKRLALLQEEFGAAGNLNGVLAAKDAARAGEPKADQISEIPKLAELQKLFLQEKAKRLEKRADALLSLRRSHVRNLGALHEKLANGGDPASAKVVLGKINQLEKKMLEAKPPPEKKIDFVEDLEMTGRFYSFVNATASFYVNGKRVHSARKGKSTSAPCEVKVGDCVVFSLHNGDGGRKRFKTSFMSDDKAYVISFAAKDLKVIPDGDRRRSVTGLEFDRMTVYANTRSHPGESAGIPFNHTSEWVWDHGNNAILAVIIKPEMIRATGETPQS